MNLLSWMRYCRERICETRTADEINYAPDLRWIDEGNWEESVCNKGCNPWHCENCCDGFGMACGFIMTNGVPIDYYIPDPYSESDCCGRKDWEEMVKHLPSPYGKQLKLF